MIKNEGQENFLQQEENIFYSVEDIQDKTSFYLSKLFEYFGEEGEKIRE